MEVWGSSKGCPVCWRMGGTLPHKKIEPHIKACSTDPKKDESPHAKICMDGPEYQPGQVNKTNTDKYKKIIWKNIYFIKLLFFWILDILKKHICKFIM